MSLLATIIDDGTAALSAVEHAAAWLLGKLATGETALHQLTVESPLLSEAVVVGEAMAAAHGVPIAAIEGVGEKVLAATHAFATDLMHLSPPMVAAAVPEQPPTA